MIKLGSKVKDFITGFKGMAIARCVYLNGCIRIEIQPEELDKDGKIIEAVWIDESQLTKIMHKVEIGKKKEEIGGPGSIPSELNHP